MKAAFSFFFCFLIGSQIMASPGVGPSASSREDRTDDRFPKDEALFKLPPGPKEGGVIRIEHPRADQGLMRINADGSYQYRTKLMGKSKSSSIKLATMTPPKILTEETEVSFLDMYGDDSIYSLDLDFQWQPFRGFGALGLKLGLGLTNVTARGFFRNQTDYRQVTRSEESYSLFILPVSLFLEYRFEYFRQQWVVPFINGGGTLYGLMELRDDGASPVFAGLLQSALAAVFCCLYRV